MNHKTFIRWGVLSLLTAALLAGCASEKMLQASHKKMPTWVNELPRSVGDTIYFYGVGKAAERNDAERSAHTAAAMRISESLVVVMRSVYSENIKSDPSKENSFVETISRSLTNNILQGMLLSDSYWELWQKGEEKYIIFHGRIGITTREYEKLRSETKNRLVKEQETIRAAEELSRTGNHQAVVDTLYPLLASGLLINEIYPLVYKSYTELKSHQKALDLVNRAVQLGLWTDQEAAFMRETQEVALIDQIEGNPGQIDESIRNAEQLLRSCHSRTAFERAGSVYGRMKAKVLFEEIVRNAPADGKIGLVGFFSGKGEALNPTDPFSQALIGHFKNDQRTMIVETDVIRRAMERKGYRKLSFNRLQEIVREGNLRGVYVIHDGSRCYIQKTDSDNLVTARTALIPSSDDFDRRKSDDIFNIRSLQFFGCVPCNNSGQCSSCKGTGNEQCSTCSGTHKIRKEMMCTECAGKGSFADQKRCGTCGGNGGPWRKCATCNGSGKMLLFGVEIGCTTCGGAGQYGCTSCKGQGSVPYDRPCSTCNGSGKKFWHENCVNCDTNGRVKCRDCGGKKTCPSCVK